MAARLSSVSPAPQLVSVWHGIGRRRVELVAGAVMISALGMLAEVRAAMRHAFLPSQPAHEITGVLGPEDGTPITLAVLGDSTVAGVGATRPQETLTYGVAKALATSRRVHLHALGVSGARLADVVEDQVPLLTAVDPDVVLVCVGTNDVTHVTPLREFRAQSARLAERLHSCAPNAVIVVSGLPAAGSARAFAQPLRALLGLRARQLSRIYRRTLPPAGIEVFDVASAARGAFNRRRELFSADGFHPSDAGYAYLSAVFGRAVEDAVSRRSAGLATGRPAPAGVRPARRPAGRPAAASA